MPATRTLLLVLAAGALAGCSDSTPGGGDAGAEDLCKSKICTSTTYCDPASGECKLGCAEDVRCNSNELCDKSTHQCVCQSGYHRCASGCIADDSELGCGTSCQPCTTDPNARASCVSGACQVQCKTGFHGCGGTCVPSDSPATCGTLCAPCPTSANGKATCDAAQCGLACDAGFHACGGKCVSNTSVDTCGTSCTPCAKDPHGSASCTGTTCQLTCDAGFTRCQGACAACPTAGATAFACSGASCVATTCSAGYHLCAGACVSNTSVLGCGTSCSACGTDPNGSATCNGTSCSLSCNAGYKLCGGGCAACPAGASGTACSGSACVPTSCSTGYHLCGTSCLANNSVLGCGSSCTPCPAGANQTATCDGTTCGVTCSSGTRTCGGTCALCPSGAGVLTTACSGTSCVATSCQVGYIACSTGCCAVTRQTVDTGATGVAAGPAIALEASGRPSISYYDTTSRDLKFATYDGTQWVKSTVDSTGDVGRASALVVVGSSRYVAYADTTNALVKLATWSGTSWSTRPITTQGGNAISMVASASKLHIADLTIPPCCASSATLSYTTVDLSTGAVSSSVVLTESNMGPSVSIALRPSDGQPGIAYYGKDSVQKFVQYTGSTWISDPPPSLQARGCSLKYDVNSRPVITMYESGGAGLNYASKGGTTSWGSEQLIDNTHGSGTGDHNALVIAPDGTLHVSYYDVVSSGSGSLKYAFGTGSSFVKVVLDSSTAPGAGVGTSMVRDSGGRFHLAYSDTTTGAVRYARVDP